ncbi:hypothetical protein T4C_1871 [Trichinella pseudospiralis]|uniref:Uncharacterized protein n=1 Tax=Trichinella pseudospiralis TaxID=6337 RepID=A0A0V1JX03_TRIPS|nr:hypothetical protein T4C_1871 [Trichinella pseudospiralis]
MDLLVILLCIFTITCHSSTATRQLIFPAGFTVIMCRRLIVVIGYFAKQMMTNGHRLVEHKNPSIVPFYWCNRIIFTEPLGDLAAVKGISIVGSEVNYQLSNSGYIRILLGISNVPFLVTITNGRAKSICTKTVACYIKFEKWQQGLHSWIKDDKGCGMLYTLAQTGYFVKECYALYYLWSLLVMPDFLTDLTSRATNRLCTILVLISLLQYNFKEVLLWQRDFLNSDFQLFTTNH